MPDTPTSGESAPLCVQYEICLDPLGDHRRCPGSGDGECHGPRDCTGTEVGCRHCEAGMYPATGRDPARCSCPHRLVDWVHETIGHPYAECPLHGRVTRMADDFLLGTSGGDDAADG